MMLADELDEMDVDGDELLSVVVVAS